MVGVLEFYGRVGLLYTFKEAPVNRRGLEFLGRVLYSFKKAPAKSSKSWGVGILKHECCIASKKHRYFGI